MPLFVGERAVSSSINSSAELMQDFPELEKTSCEFASKEQRTFGNETILYIGQREYGTVYPNDNSVDIIGSDSATTCQIVVLRHKGSGVCSLAHFDGVGISEALAEMVASLQDHVPEHKGNRIEMHIVGGFSDSRKSSEDVFMKILRGACQTAFEIDLLCTCVCNLNDTIMNGKHVPIIYGLGVLVQSGEVVPVKQFDCQIPDEILRHCVIHSYEQKVLQVYSSLTQEVKIKPVDVFCPKEIAMSRASLSDEIILKNFSTSPHCEPPNFAEKLRKMFQFLAENQNILQKYFPRGEPRRFRLNDNREWCLVENNS